MIILNITNYILELYIYDLCKLFIHWWDILWRADEVIIKCVLLTLAKSCQE